MKCKTSLRILLTLHSFASVISNTTAEDKITEGQQNPKTISTNPSQESTFINNSLNYLIEGTTDIPVDIHYISSNIYPEKNVSSLGFMDSLMNDTERENSTLYINKEEEDGEDYADYYDYTDFSENELRQITFTKTLYFCEYIFSAMYGEYSSFPDSGITHDNKSVTVIHEAKFLNVCAPFYQLYNKDCLDKGSYTLCVDESVLMLKPHKCKKPSDNDVHFDHLLAGALLVNDESCYRSVCEGKTRIIDHVVDGAHVRLLSTEKRYKKTVCEGVLQNYYLLNDSDEVYGLKNIHWPCCYPGHIMLVSKGTQNHETSGSWNYLTQNCRTWETIIFVMIVIIIISSIIGNTFVLIVLLGKQCLRPGFELLNISLAISDLALCLFVMVPAMNMHLMLMNGDGENVMIFKPEDDIINALEYDQDNAVPKSGSYMFSSFVFHCCSLNSIYILSTLSYERLKDYSHLPIFDKLPPHRPGPLVGVIWIMSILTSFVSLYDKKGFMSEWNSYAKIPLGVSTRGKSVTLPILMAFLGTYCLITIVMMALAVYYYRMRKRKISPTQTFGSTSETTYSDKEEDSTIPMIMMTIFFTISTIAGGTATLIYAKSMKFHNTELVSYTCWWIFFCSTSWNPWLYNLSSRKFRERAIRRTKMITAAICWGGSWNQSESSNNQSLDGDEGVGHSSSQDIPTISASIERQLNHREVSV